MEGVRRVDLSGSGVTDVSWVTGGVTWLSLAGCPVEKGWEAIGELKELSGTPMYPSGSLHRNGPWSKLINSIEYQRMRSDSTSAQPCRFDESQGDRGYEQPVDHAGR